MNSSPLSHFMFVDSNHTFVSTPHETEFCEALVQEGGDDGGEDGGGGSLSLNNCGLDEDDEEGDGDDQDEDNQDEGEYGDYYYSFMVSAEAAEDFQSLCQEVQSLQGVTWETTTYDESTAEYDESDYDTESTSMAGAGAGLSTGAIAAITGIALIAGIAIGAVALKFASSRKSQKEEDPKEFHLVDEPKGTLA